MHIIKPTNTFSFKWGATSISPSYYNLYFGTQWIDLFKTDLKRNTSIFVEEPCYVVVLSFALLFIYLFKDNIKNIKFKLTILIVAMVTTFSVTGYLFIVLLFLISAINTKKEKYFVLFIGIPIFIILFIILIIMKSSSGSCALRSTDSKIVFDSWKLSHIFGNGYGNTNKLGGKMVSDRQSTAIASSFGAILMQGRIVYLILYIIPIFKCLKDGIENKKIKYLFLSFSYFLFLLVILYFLYKFLCLGFDIFY